MIEENIRRLLPRFINASPIARVTNCAREQVPGKLPPLIDDTRANYLARIEGGDGDIYVKAVASPWPGKHGIHFLVIPDRKEHINIPGIADLSPQALGASLRLAESLGYSMLQQEGISEVDIGINHSRSLTRTRKSHLASVPQNLHIHVTGYNPKDFEPVSIDDVIKSSELTGRTGEALYVLEEQLFFGEIVPVLKDVFPSFNAIFSEIRDQRGRRRFQMNDGRNGFDHPDLSKILQMIDVLAKQKYDELAKCFLKLDGKDETERYQLLPKEDRLQNIDRYIGNHQGLSIGVRLGLKFLAAIVKDEQTVVRRELDILERKKGSPLTDTEKDIQIGHIANRFWAYRDLAYALVWSAKRGDNDSVVWIFGFDPKVFTIHGPHQSSAFTSKIVERDLSGCFTETQLHNAQTRETRVLMQTKKEIEELKLRD